MSNNKNAEQPKPVQSTRLPWTYKFVVHSLSIFFLPGTLSAVLIVWGPGPGARMTLSAAVTVFAIPSIWVWLLYAIAGGFDWEPGPIGCERTVLYALLGGIAFAIPLFIFWLLIRVICCVVFRLPIAAGAGKIWVSGERSPK